MNGELRGTHDLGEIIGLSYRVYARCFVPLFAIALVTVPLRMLTGIAQDRRKYIGLRRNSQSERKDATADIRQMLK